jgi:hypothetical protein
MTSNLPIGTEIETTRQLLGVSMFVNNVYRQSNIPAGQLFTITERHDVPPRLARYWGTYAYRATATVNGETHVVEFDSTYFDNGSVRVSMRKLKSQGRDLTSLMRVGLDKNLPDELESLTGEFLSGEKGTTGSQMDAMQQKLGKSLARRPSGRPSGGRRTKKSKRRARKTRRRHK